MDFDPYTTSKKKGKKRSFLKSNFKIFGFSLTDAFPLDFFFFGQFIFLCLKISPALGIPRARYSDIF